MTKPPNPKHFEHLLPFLTTGSIRAAASISDEDREFAVGGCGEWGRRRCGLISQDQHHLCKISDSHLADEVEGVDEEVVGVRSKA